MCCLINKHTVYIIIILSCIIFLKNTVIRAITENITSHINIYSVHYRNTETTRGYCYPGFHEKERKKKRKNTSMDEERTKTVMSSLIPSFETRYKQGN